MSCRGRPSQRIASVSPMKQSEVDRLCTPQREDRDLWPAIEAEWHTDAAESAINVQLHRAYLEQARYILAAPGWQVEGTDEGEPDLAPVRMPAENPRYCFSGWVSLQPVDVIRCVAH